jgi:ParB family transcriptional regulator, chromosome partitioning protein
MHPADELEAFQKLVEEGQSVADVAARFGVSESVVTRRLALARVNPSLLKLYRAGEINLDLLQAFTLSDDHELQEQIWTGLPAWNRRPHIIRQMLTSDAVSGIDKRVLFIGLGAYEAAGGRVRRDLFSEGNEGVQLLDMPLLIELTNRKLQSLADVLQKEGWKWVEIQPELNYQFLGRFRRLTGDPTPLTEEEEAKIDKLTARREALESKLTDDDEEANEKLYERINELSEKINVIQYDRPLQFSAEVKAQAGAVVSISEQGAPEYVYGLLSKEDERRIGKEAPNRSEDAAESQGEEHEDESKKEAAASYSAALTESLTMYKTAALAAELSGNPNVALVAIAHALVLSQFGLDLGLYRSQTCLQLSTSQPHLEEAKDSLAMLSLQAQKQQWLSVLPREEDELWAWCLEQGQDVLLRLIAFCAAQSINAVQAKHESEDHQRLQHANALGVALQIDMTKWFVPTAENFFGRISKAQIRDCLQEMGNGTSTLATLKKDKLAQLAESEVEGTGWLPRTLRLPGCKHEVTS